MGVATVLIGVLPTYQQVALPGPAGARPRRPGTRVRRRVGRRDPDDLRARPLADGLYTGDHTGRVPGRAAAGQLRVPDQRPAGRHVGVAGAVPAVRGADRRGHLHPAQGRGVPGVRGAQGGGRPVEEPAQGGSPRRLAQHPAGVLPADRRDRRLRGVGDVHAVLHLRARTWRPADHPDRHDDRGRHRHLRDDLLRRAGPTRSAAARCTSWAARSWSPGASRCSWWSTPAPRR